MKSLGRRCESTGVENDEFVVSQQDVKERTLCTELTLGAKATASISLLPKRGVDLVPYLVNVDHYRQVIERARGVRDFHNSRQYLQYL